MENAISRHVAGWRMYPLFLTPLLHPLSIPPLLRRHRFFTLPCAIVLLANSPTSAPFIPASLAGAKDLYAYFYSC